jgi:hypothetical protein
VGAGDPIGEGNENGLILGLLSFGLIETMGLVGAFALDDHLLLFNGGFALKGFASAFAFTSEFVTVSRAMICLASAFLASAVALRASARCLRSAYLAIWVSAIAFHSATSASAFWRSDRAVP